MKKVELNKRLYNVVTPEEYTTRQADGIYSTGSTAVECRDGTVVLPLNSKPTDKAVGVYFYPNGMVGRVNKPEENSEHYSTDRVIDYSKATSIADVINNNKILKNTRDDIIASNMSGSNMLKLIVDEENDSPQMKVLKQAINAKNIDKRQYEYRFSQFNNDMRLLKGHSITFAKLASICAGFDIQATLTLSDASGSLDPMDAEFTINLTDEVDMRDGGY